MRLFQDGPSPCLVGGLALDGNFATADAHDVMITFLLNDLGLTVLAFLFVNLLILLFLHLLGHLLIVLIVLSLLSIIITIFHFANCLYFCLFKYI